MASRKPGTVNYVGTEIDSIWTIIAYHVWWPGQGNDPMYLANQNMNRTRNNYYENNYTPHMFTNGKSSGSNTTNWKNDPKKYVNEIGLYDISISGSQTGNDINFSVKSSAVKNVEASANIRLFIAIVMGHVMYVDSPNGLQDHQNAVIELVLGNTGKRIKYISLVEYEETVSWSMPSEWVNHSKISWNSENLKVVAWIQDYSSKTILQVAEFDFK